MPYAFGHLTIAWLLGKIIEKIKKIKLSRPEWFLLLFGSIFPDTDFLIDWTLGKHIHRTFTHSFFMIIVGFLIVYLICLIFFKELNRKKFGIYFSIGILTHLIADMIMGYPGVGLLWPLHYNFWFFGITKTYVSLHAVELTREQLIRNLRIAIFDMGLGTLWLGYLFFKGKIKEF